MNQYPPIKQVDPTARNAAQFDSLSLSLSREQVSSPRNQTTSGWNLPQLIRLRHARSSSGTLRLYPFYSEGMCSTRVHAFVEVFGDKEGATPRVFEASFASTLQPAITEVSAGD